MAYDGFGNDPLLVPGQTAQPPQMFDPNKPLPVAGKPSSYYDLMLSLSDLGSKESHIKGQMEIANELRKTPMPGMRTNGRIMKAASPLEFANSTLRQATGASERRGAMSQQEELANEIRRRIQEERSKGSMGVNGTTPMTGYTPQAGE